MDQRESAAQQARNAISEEDKLPLCAPGRACMVTACGGTASHGSPPPDRGILAGLAAPPSAMATRAVPPLCKPRIRGSVALHASLVIRSTHVGQYAGRGLTGLPMESTRAVTGFPVVFERRELTGPEARP